MAMTKTEEIVRGHLAGSGGSANHAHPQGRVCSDERCTTVLSIYNSTGWCWQHERPHPYVLQAPRKRRKDARDARTGPWTERV
jgi:hypothetical protein